MHFIFTDIVGSSRLWHEHGDAMATALQLHDALASRAVASHGGRIVKHTGDGVFAVFEAGDPLGFALEFQRTISATRWDTIGSMQVRVGIASGEARCWAGDFFGPAVNRAARLAEAASGGQTIVTANALAAQGAPRDAEASDLGLFTFGDLGEPERVYQLADQRLPPGVPEPPKSPLVRPQTLPIPSTPFIGREREVSEIIALVREPDVRLITLLGPGGIGKTRLAIQVASLLAEEFSWGAYFVPLVAVSESHFLVNATSEALHLPLRGGSPFEDQLMDYVGNKRLILIYDNLEQVSDGSSVLARLVSHCPEIKVMATSRQRLLLQGEQVYEVRGLAFPQRPDDPRFEDYDAPRLFLQAGKSRAAIPSLGREDRDAILRICRVAEGMPLALELAASWLPALGLEAVARRMEERPLDLPARIRDAPERHRSLGAALDYSYGLLSPTERTALRALSVFESSFTTEAALRIADATLETVASLVDKSLVRQTVPDRLELHEMTRRFSERLLAEDEGEAKSILGRFIGYYARFLEVRAADLLGPESRATRDAIRTEMPNILRAWGAAILHGDVEAIASSLDAVYSFFRVPGLDDQGNAMLAKAEEALGAIVSAAPGDGAAEEALARVRIRRGHFQALACAWEEAAAGLRQGLRMARKRGLHGESAMALQTLGRLWFMQGRLRRSHGAFRITAALHRQAADLRSLVIVLSSLGHVEDARGDHAAARVFHLEAAATAPKAISPRLRAYLGCNLGAVECTMGNVDEARRILGESLRAAMEDGDPSLISHVSGALGEVCLLEDDYVGAEALFYESFEARSRIGDATLIICAAARLARVANLQGRPDKAREWAETGMARAQARGLAEPATECLVQAAWAQLRLSGPAAAAMTLACALDEARRSDDFDAAARAMVVAAMIAAEKGASTRAVEILSSIASAPPDAAVAQWSTRVLQAYCAQMSPDEAAAARGRGSGTDWRILARSWDPRSDDRG